ncbi:MAG: hypothetical protein ACOC0B_02660, partial [bacterium]
MSKAEGDGMERDGAGDGRAGIGRRGRARGTDTSRGTAGRGSGMKISTRLFLSYVTVLVIAVIVAFASSEAVTPYMMRWHGARSTGRGMR